MIALFWLINTVLDIFQMMLIVYVVLSWLTAFGVVNSHQPLVRSIMYFLHALIEPVVQPIRRFVPSLNGIDLSVLILFLLVKFVQIFIQTSLAPALLG